MQKEAHTSLWTIDVIKDNRINVIVKVSFLPVLIKLTASRHVPTPLPPGSPGLQGLSLLHDRFKTRSPKRRPRLWLLGVCVNVNKPKTQGNTNRVCVKNVRPQARYTL